MNIRTAWPSDAGMELSWESLGRMFYLVEPSSTMFDKLEDVPNYVQLSSLYYGLFPLVEIATGCLFHGLDAFRVNDTVCSLSAGIASMIFGLLHKSLELVMYAWVYDRFHVVDLDPHSMWVWAFTFIAVDFCYYWFHRCAHEINFMWGAHQVHHSSEYYNITTALRQSIVQGYTSGFFYLPFALVIPPSMFAVHKHLNSLYQLWIHTECIGTLGPLEYILNTPSHHRVHHGRNRYCIDKNYAGTLIVWDRLFGTFAKESEQVVYGLVHPINTFDVWYVQFHHYKSMFSSLCSATDWRQFSSILLCGPGWSEGTGRLGSLEHVPDIRAPQLRHDPPLPWSLNVYVALHSVVIVLCFMVLMACSGVFSPWLTSILAVFSLLSLTSFGALLDRKPVAFVLEVWRILLYLVAETICWTFYDTDLLGLWYPDFSGASVVCITMKMLRGFFFLSSLYLVVCYTPFPLRRKQTDASVDGSSCLQKKVD